MIQSLHHPPSSFTPRSVREELAVDIAAVYGLITDPVCGKASENVIVCTVDFPPVNGRYLGWNVRIEWDGHRLHPHVGVIPQA